MLGCAAGLFALLRAVWRRGPGQDACLASYTRVITRITVHIMCAIFAFVGFQDSSAAIELLLLHV